MTARGPEWRCDAFDKLPIPEEIFTGVNRHTSDFPGDNGLHFEPK